MTTAAEKKRVKARLKTLGLRDEVIDRRVDELGLSEDDMLWNERLGRPLHWKETLDPEAEKQRRAEWSRLNPGA